MKKTLRVILFVFAILTSILGIIYISISIINLIRFIKMYYIYFEDGLVNSEIYSYIVSPIISIIELISGVIFSLIYIIFNIKNGFVKGLYCIVSDEIVSSYNERKKNKLKTKKQKLQNKIEKLNRLEND